MLASTSCSGCLHTTADFLSRSLTALPPSSAGILQGIRLSCTTKKSIKMRSMLDVQYWQSIRKRIPTVSLDATRRLMSFTAVNEWSSWNKNWFPPHPWSFWCLLTEVSIWCSTKQWWLLTCCLIHQKIQQSPSFIDAFFLLFPIEGILNEWLYKLIEVLSKRSNIVSPNFCQRPNTTHFTTKSNHILTLQKGLDKCIWRVIIKDRRVGLEKRWRKVRISQTSRLRMDIFSKQIFSSRVQCEPRHQILKINRVPFRKPKSSLPDSIISMSTKDIKITSPFSAKEWTGHGSVKSYQRRANQ